MGTISSALSLTTGALDADQAALNVVANNVANANTTGYTEETPTWKENEPIEVGGVSVGDGVTESGAASRRDLVLQERLDQQQQLESASGTRLAALNNIQALFTPDSGSSSSTAGDIGSDITSFFDSFSSLESDPTDNALREQVLSSASTLAGDISGAASSLNAQSAAIDQEATGMVSQVNSLSSAIAQLNLEIESTSPHADAGALEDQRQQDLSQLSQLVGISQVTTENNGLSVTTTSGQLLVSEGQNFQLTTGTVNGVTDFFVGGTDITSQLASGGGQLGGYLTARNMDIPNAMSWLDQLAYSVSTEVNAQNNSGVDAHGATGAAVAGSTTGAMTLDIFSPPPTYAANQASGGTDVAGAAQAMSVVMTDPNLIAAAALGNGTGDNSNAVAMADLSGGPIVNGQTPINYYSNFVSTLGATVSEVQTENTAQNASVTQLQTQNNALSSVNLNDEAAAMSTLENSYQAASRVFTLLNTIMASALNLGVETAVA
ncbi:MAG: flagellar hook-associated protein FlgK [Terracidiphilus sp.]|jgi:flagellar hook-associated protein 1 FlgK